MILINAISGKFFKLFNVARGTAPPQRQGQDPSPIALWNGRF